MQEIVQTVDNVRVDDATAGGHEMGKGVSLETGRPQSSEAQTTVDHILPLRFTATGWWTRTHGAYVRSECGNAKLSALDDASGEDCRQGHDEHDKGPTEHALKRYPIRSRSMNDDPAHGAPYRPAEHGEPRQQEQQGERDTRNDRALGS